MRRTVWMGTMAGALALAAWSGTAIAQSSAAGPAATAPAEAAKPAAPPLVPISQIPLETFARLPFVDQVSLSPDGMRIAGKIGYQGMQIISIYNLFDKNEKPVNVLVPEGNEAHGLQWVNNDNVLLHVSALLTVVDDRWSVRRLLSINRSSGKVNKMLWHLGGQDTADVLWTAKDGSPNFLLAGQDSVFLGPGFYPKVYSVDASNGKYREVQGERTGVMNWYADASGAVRAAVSYDDTKRRFSMLYRPEGRGAYKVVDRADTRKNEGLLSPFVFLPGGDNALAIHDDDKGKAAIYEVNLTTQADVRQVYAAPEGFEVEGVWLSADGQTMLGAYNSGGPEEIHWFDPDLADVQTHIAKSVGNRRARIISLSDDRSRMLIKVDRPDNPGVLYYFNLATSKMQQIAQYNSELSSRPLSPVKLVRYNARDGLSIEAVLTLPRDRPQMNLPIVVMPHGGPWSQDVAEYDYWTQFLASRGYAVLQPNFRGSTGYGTEFLKAGEGQMGLKMQDDITDGLAWAVKEGIADPKRACIVGASYGGYAAMWGIAKDPDLYRCAISIAGVANLRREVNDFGDALYGNKYKDDWTKMTPDFAAVSPVNAVAQIKAPLLLIHGKKDITVDFNQSQQMFSRMTAAGKTVDLVPLKEADHYFSREADRIVLLRSIEAFLAKHNPADPAPLAAAVAPAAKP